MVGSGLVATKTRSTSIVRSIPPRIYWTITLPLGPRMRERIVVCVRTDSGWSRCKRLLTASLTSSSSVGKMRDDCSATDTVLPKVAKKCASSIAVVVAPMINRLRGGRLSLRAVRGVSQSIVSIPAIAGWVTCAPVAIKICPAVTS